MMQSIEQESGQLLPVANPVLGELQSLHEQGRTGSLVLTGPNGDWIHVYFREGMIDAVSSSQNGRRIGDFLFDDQYGSKADRDSLASEARRQKILFAEVAIRRGLVDTAEVIAAARSQAMELLGHALKNQFEVESFSSSLRSHRVPARINFAFVKLELARREAIPFNPQSGMQIVLSEAADIPAFPWHPEELGVRQARVAQILVLSIASSIYQTLEYGIELLDDGLLIHIDHIKANCVHGSSSE